MPINAVAIYAKPSVYWNAFSRMDLPYQAARNNLVITWIHHLQLVNKPTENEPCTKLRHSPHKDLQPRHSLQMEYELFHLQQSVNW